MKVKELAELLSSLPEDMEVFYEDPMYGGVLQELVPSDLQLIEEQILIRIPFAYFEED